MATTRSVLDQGIEVTDAARELAGTIDVDAFAGLVTDAIMTEVWHYLDDPSFREAVHESVLGNIRVIYEIIDGKLRLEDASPQGALDFAATAAQLGVPSSEVERAYRVGQAFFWMRFFDLACTHADTSGIPLADLLGGPSAVLLRYIDHILAPVVTRYDETWADLHKTRGQLRRLTLMQIFDGTITRATDELDRLLDYRMATVHLAVLFQGERMGGSDPDPATLREAADAEQSLVFQHAPRSWLVWLGRREEFDAKRLSRLRRVLAAGDFDIAVGEPASGVEGFCLTRAQALETARVQRALGYDGHRSLWASDVRLEALLLHDEDRARRFVAEELGRLAEEDTLAERLRETLLAWLATGSHVSAAAILGVHENTVRNRIRHAEQLLGSPLLPRRTELQVALRLERVLEALAAAPADE
jgi:hypothetical protein